MIEIICKEELAKENQNRRGETLCLPKNIRQEGSPRGRHKIYLEDYVHTYLKNVSKGKDKCAAVFLGKSQVEKDIRYTFISGLIECSEAVFQWESISLDDSFWDYIYKEEKQYFPDLEIVGWFLGKSGQVMELSSAVEAAHRKYFSGRDKILMIMDILEEEELFFVYEQGYLQKREGYYIYYEKNLAMQEYMICKREEEQARLEELKKAEAEKEMPGAEVQEEELPEQGQVLTAEEQEEKKENSSQTERDAKAMLVQMRKQEKKAERRMREGIAHQKLAPQEEIFAKSDLEEPKSQAEEALEAYRRTILERQGRNRERQSRRLLYTASSFFLVVISVIGITTINNYKKMQQVEEVLSVLNPQASDPKKEHTSEDNELVVKSVESQVSPLDETQRNGNIADNKEENTADSAGSQTDMKMEPGQEPQNPDETSGHPETQGDGETAGSAENDKPAGDKQKDKPENKDTSEQQSTENDSQEDDSQQNTQDNTRETEAQVGSPRYYTVQPGDTLSTICMSVYKNKSMVQTLKEVNGIEDGDKILAGQRLLLP